MKNIELIMNQRNRKEIEKMKIINHIKHQT